MICRRDDTNDTSPRLSGARLHAPLSEDKACALAQSDQRGHERASVQDSRSKRTSCGLALAAGLGAVRRQPGRKHLLLAVLGDVLAGLVHDARVGLVRTRCERHNAHSSVSISCSDADMCVQGIVVAFALSSRSRASHWCCASCVSFQDSLLDYSARPVKRCVFAASWQVHNGSVIPYHNVIVPRTALSARLGAVDCQLGREHLLGTVLGDLTAGLVHHP